jgi:hypothetical protein
MAWGTHGAEEESGVPGVPDWKVVSGAVQRPALVTAGRRTAVR